MKNTILACFIVVVASNQAVGEELLGSRPLSMGGAHAAVSTGNDAIFFNPAGMSLFRRYTLETNYLHTPKTETQGSLEHTFNVSVVDNQIQSFATGMSYSRIDRDGSKKGNRYDLAFSTAITDNLFIGTNIKYINFDIDGKIDAVDAVSVDAGLLLRTTFGLSLAVAGYNLTNPADYLEHPVSMRTGAMFSPFRTLALAFDWHINFQRPVDAAALLGKKETAYSYHFGLEYLVFGQLAVRGGYLMDHARIGPNDHFWSAGLSYVSQRMALDFGYRSSIDHPSHRVFAVGLKLFL